MPRLRWLLVAILVLLVGLALFGLPLWGRAALALLPADLHLTASGVSGPLWAPRLSGARLALPGLGAHAGQAQVSVAGLDLRARTVRLNVALRDAVLDADLGKLLGGKSSGGGWRVLPGRLDIENVRANINGRALALPKAELRVTGSGDAAQVLGTTSEGGLRADVRLQPGSDPVAGTADIRADARLINYFWKHAVKGGVFTGRYTFGRAIQGDLKLSGGVIEVPNARFARVQDVTGVLTQRGNIFTAELNGVGLGGPVSAQGRVDLSAKRWTVSALAEPTLGGLASALGTTGSGRARVTANAGGWTRVDARVAATGAGEVAGVPVRNLDVRYVYQQQKSNRVELSGLLGALGGQQQLKLDWEVGVRGTGSLAGTLLNAPLDLGAQLNGNRVSLTGRALGGPLTARYDFGTRDLAARLAPVMNGVRADVRASGQPTDLRLQVARLQAGPLDLSGSGRVDARGARLDLGAVQVDLDRRYQGTWRLRDLNAYGVTLNGAGRVDVPRNQLSGDLAAALPAGADRLSGPLTYDWKAHSGRWTTDRAVLGVTGSEVSARLNAFHVAGLTLNGALTVAAGPRVGGRLTASGAPGTLTLRGEGRSVALDGWVRGQAVTGRTQLTAGFPTTLSAAGGAVQASVDVRDGVNVRLRTGSEVARASVRGQAVTASGALDLAVLRDLTGVADLGGRLAFQPGDGRALSATLTARGAGASARLNGQVYPDVNVTGAVTYQNQTLQAQVRGPYGRLGFSAKGRTPPLSASGVQLPAQAVTLSGSLTPALAVRGQVGGVNLRYADGQVLAQGQLALTANGQPGTLQLNASYGPGWTGQVQASGAAGGYRVNASGPWRALRLRVTGPDELSATARLDAATLRYTARVTARTQGVYVRATVTGQRDQFRADGTASDGAGGTARLHATSLQAFDVDLAGLTLAGQTFTGQLSAQGGRVTGDLRAGALRLTARQGHLVASGAFSGTDLNATADLTLPSTLRNVRVQARGSWGHAALSGSGQALRGQLDLAAQRRDVSGIALGLPAQRVPLSASLTPLRVTAGGLTYAGGWSGALDLRYLAGGAGRVRVTGDGARLRATASGPVTGQLTLLPALGGTLSVNLAPLWALLPAQVRAVTVPGRLVVRVAPTSARATLADTRYAGEALTGDADVSWQGGLRAGGVLTQPGTHLPFTFTAQRLRVADARVDGRALRPFLAGATGSVRGRLDLPGLDLQRGQGTFDVDLSAGAQAARGRVTLARGALSATLDSTLGGTRVSVQGPLYPTANAALRVDGVQGHLEGRVREGLTLTAAGAYQGHSVNLSARYAPQRLSLDASVSGARLLGQAQQGADGWVGSLSVNAPDLRALTGTAGQLSGSVSGSLNHAAGRFGGAVAGVTVSVPVRWDGRILRVQDAAARNAFARLSASGAVYPALNVSARATLSDYLPGTYALTVRGDAAAPEVEARGTLANAATGLQVGGSEVRAHLAGRNYTVQAKGTALDGEARGQLGSGAPAGLLNATFTLRAPYRLSATEAVNLMGTAGWNARTGWLGDLTARGRAGGQDLNLNLTGHGALDVRGRVGPGTLTSSLGRRFLSAPDARLRVSDVDLGALWGRAGQLGARGDVTLGGSWKALSAELSGALTDQGGDLSGDLSGRYAGGAATVRLAGAHLSANGSFAAGRLQAQLSASGARLARLTPPAWNLTTLDLTGQASVDTRGPGGLTVQARGLDVRGEQAQTGRFSAQGNLEYSPGAVGGSLRVAALGGTLVASGALPQGVQVTATRLDLTRFGLGELNGTITGQGDLLNPVLAGRLTTARREAQLTLDLGGRARQPNARVTADLRAPYAGRVYADARRLTFSPLGADLELYGTATQGGNRVQLDLRGRWPKLAGQVNAQLGALNDPVRLTGDGRGTYLVTAGAVGSGRITLSGEDLIPQLQANLNVTPLGLLGASGRGALTVAAAGPLNALTVNLGGQLSGVERSGVRLGDLTFSGGGALTDLRADVRQGNRPVLTYQAGTATVTDLQAQLAGSTVSVTGRAGADGVTARMSATGSVEGNVQATYRDGALAANGDVGVSGATATFAVREDKTLGWAGSGRVSGLPQQVVTRDLNFSVSGPQARPQLTGDLGLLGAEARLVASAAGSTLTLSNGEGAQASGRLQLVGAALGGQVTLTRSEGRVRLALSGTTSAPQARVDGLLGGWTASGALGLKSGQLALGDGERSGTLQYADGALQVDLPGLDLARLKLVQVAGRVTATGRVALDGQSGQVQLGIAGLTTGGTLPLVNLPVRGDLTARVTGVAGTWSAQVQATHPNGTLGASLGYRAGRSVTGRVDAQLAQGGGDLRANLQLTGGGVQGRVNVTDFPLTSMGLTERLTALVELTGQDFTVTASAAGDAGRLRASGGGAIADVYAPLGRALGLQGGSGYQVDAQLSGLDLQALKLAPYLNGTATGSATVTDGGASFVLRAADLRADGVPLPTRVEGTLAGDQWRIRGNVGDSQLFGSVQGGALSGRLTLTALPVSNLVGAITGPLPGSALLTGVARFDVPLADPLSGSADLVLERLTVRGSGQTLSGQGVLAYRNRELSSLNVQLSGAGTWDIQGQYTRRKVDVRAALSGTDFTPLLALVPSIRDQQPTLRGDLTLTVGGTYDAPQASLNAPNFRGSLGDYRLDNLALSGTLGGGRFSAQGRLGLSGAAASQSTLSLSGELGGGRLSNTVAQLRGNLALRQVGSIGSLFAQVSQQADRWALDATATQGGTLRVEGNLTPALDLRIAARAYAPQLPVIYGRETSFTGDLTLGARGSDFVLGGALRADRLVLGSVAAPAGTTPAKASATDQPKDASAGFVSPLPPELTTFPTKNGKPPENPLLSRIVLDNIPITLPNGARIDEDLIRADLAGGLTLAGRASDLRLTGSVQTTRGTVFLRENEFTVRSGVATFDGQSAFPTFSVQASGNVPDQGNQGAPVGVNVNITGSFPFADDGTRALKLDTRFACTANCQANGHDYSAANPNAEAQLYALVALGTPDIGSLPGNIGGLGTSALRTALNVFVLGQVERGLAQAFGVDVFRIRTNLLDATLNGTGDITAQFTVGSYLTRELFFEYSIDLTGQGLLDATYTTPDNRFTFRVSTPLSGLNLSTLRPSFTFGFNVTPSSSITLGVENGATSNAFRVGYDLKF